MTIFVVLYRSSDSHNAEESIAGIFSDEDAAIRFATDEAADGYVLTVRTYVRDGDGQQYRHAFRTHFISDGMVTRFDASGATTARVAG